MSNSSRSGIVGGVARVSIPTSMRRTIQNIKEITGNHSDDEIYAMLRECSMDPNETTQKLLSQDTFHEVKRKRDRRKENSVKESAEPKWKTGMQGRGNKGIPGNVTSRHASHDVGGGKNGKDNITNQILDRSVNLSSVPNVDGKNISSSLSATVNGPSVLASGSHIIVQNAHASTRRVRQFEANKGVQTAAADASKNPKAATGNRDVHGQRMPNSRNSSRTQSSPPPSGAYLSASDPVLLPSQDSRSAGVVGTVRREVGSQHSSTPVEHVSSNTSGSKKTTAISDAGSSKIQVKMPSKFQGPGKNQLQEYSQTASSTHGGSSVSRPSSNYNNRSQTVGPQKGPYKEWKPKPVSSNLAQGSALAAAASSGISTVSFEVNTRSQPPPAVPETKEVTEDLQKKLQESHISDVEHVIIPNHLHVPEVEKLGFCFGSFDTSFSLGTSTNIAPEHDRSPPLSEASECIEEAASEQLLSNQNASASAEDTDYSDQPPPSHGQESLPAKGDDISSSAPEYSEPKQETLQAGQQYSVVHTPPNYNFGFVPPMLGNQLPPFESSESQPRDVSRLPNFLVQQHIDPTSYYAQYYRSSADSDGRISPFHSAGVSTQYNGNVAIVPHTSQSSQEGGNTHALSAAAPTSLVTQATGLMQSSIAVPQQPVPIFRQATGMHLPHYPPNYIPYGHYFSPLYVPPTAIHQLLSNGAFSQQPQAGGIYPPPPSAAARYSLSQYRPGTNVGNSAHMGVPGTYAPYGSSPVNYNPSSATTGNPASNEDLSASQFQESNVFVSGQQSESSGVWINAHNRDLSSLQASSFYNLPQGQVALTPTQPGHGTFAGVYHPAQPVTASTVHPLLQQSQTIAGPVDMVGPTGNVYQRPQHSHINWPSSY